MASLDRGDWSKENVSPSANNSVSNEKSEAGRQAQKYESLISSEGKNQLNHWLEFMKWSETNLEMGAQIVLMERCVRSCMKQYKNDIRFIHICVRYADKSSSPSDVFEFLHQHDVGTKVALFWIAWAWVAETKGDYAFCEKIYKTGLAKEAAPLALMQQRQKQFQRRMTRHWLNASQQSGRHTGEGQETMKRRSMEQNVDSSSNEKTPTLFVHVDDEGVRRVENASTSNRALQERKLSAVRDPIIPQGPRETTGKNKVVVSINCGFTKELVAKDAGGQECCFEEYRAKGRHFTLLKEQNLNHLVQEESVEDVDMDTDDSTVHSKESLSARRSLFLIESSVDEHDNKGSPINASTVSSTVSRFVGMSTSREEETINTKFAMKELSMMFSSPAMGMDDSRNNDLLKRPRLNDSESFDGPLLEEDDDEQVNNSIVDIKPPEGQDHTWKTCPLTLGDAPASFKIFVDEMEMAKECTNHGENVVKIPTEAKKGFHIFSEVSVDSCANENSALQLATKEKSKEKGDPGPHEERRLLRVNSKNEKVSTEHKVSVAERKTLQCLNSDHDMSTGSPCHGLKKGFKNVDVRIPESNKPPSKGIQIYKDEEDLDEFSHSATDDADGDTATLSLFGDAMDALNDIGPKNETFPSSSPHILNCSVINDKYVKRKPFQNVHNDKEPPFFIHQEDDGRNDSGTEENEGGDTATLSVFGEAMNALNHIQHEKHDQLDSISPKGSNQSVEDNTMDDFRKYRPRDSGAILMDGAAFGDISVIDTDSSRIRFSPTLSRPDPFESGETVDYKSLHKDDVRLSLRQLNSEARPIEDGTPFADPETDLVITLSKRGNVVYLPNQTLPRALRRKASTQGEEIKVGSRTGIVKQELGRGSYGVVVLLDSDKEGAIAVKAQAPTDCLAWEYVVMKRLEQRCTTDHYPFPHPLSFILLSDGAMLGMTAGSRNGLNLVDVSNVYKLREGGQVPELIALHYTARMLKHIETLHWRGKILHCDVKPDNWVVVASDCAYDGCCDVVESADLMLVDFGRAIDLTTATREGVDPLDGKLSGDATGNGMACVAIRMNRGWSFDIDTFGICASAHVLLFGSHIDLEMDRNKRWKIRKALRRYWHKDLWSEFFDLLLNDSIASRPGSLRQFRKKIEDYLKTKNKELAYLLKHQSRIIPKKRLD